LTLSGLWICLSCGFVDNPPGAGLPTSSTLAWTTQKRRCPHTHSRYCYKRFLYFKD